MPLHLVLVLLAAAGPATAKPAPAPSPAAAVAVDEAARKQAKTLVAEAQKLYAQKRYAEAAARFERAYALRPVPAILFNLARCHDKLKDTPKALRAYRDYLRAAPGANDVAEVQAAILALEKRLRSLGLSQLLVLTDPPKARVRVEGKDLGETPVSTELVTGKYNVSLTLDGHAPEERVVDVTLEESPVLSVRMKPLPADAPRADGAANLSPPPVIQLADASSATTAVTQVADTSPRRTATWIAAGTTAAVLLAGAGCLAAAHWNASQLVNEPTRDRETRTGLYNSAVGLQETSNYVFLGALVPAAATGVLFALGK